jgi:hypothetical protein
MAFFNREINDSVYSLDYKISSRALEPRFFLDMNYISGVEITVPLDVCTVVYETDRSMLMRVPDEALNGRYIINVLNLVTSYDFDIDIYGSGIDNVGRRAFQKEVRQNSFMTTAIEKISGNEFLVNEVISDFSNTDVKILVSYSESFSEIGNGFYPDLALTAMKAVELYIYNTLIIRKGTAHLYNGYELGEVDNIINSYSNSFNEYFELINKKTKKQLFMADRTRMRNYTRLCFGGLS